MTKMAKRNKAILWTCVAAIAALLVALVFVGVTFARYSSTNTGAGSATVAVWDVNAVAANASSDKFSPSADAPDDASAESPRTNTSDYIEVATLENNGDVGALVAINPVTSDDITLIFNEDACVSSTCVNTDGTWVGSCSCNVNDPDGNDYCDFCAGYAAYGETAAQHFSLTLYYSDTEGPAYNLIEENSTFEVAAGGTEYLYATVTWTSDITDCYGAAADEFDTWCGHYLASISFTITFEAYQSTALTGSGN